MRKKSNWKAWVFLSIGLFVTITVSFIVKYKIDQLDETEFWLECKGITRKIEI